MRIDRDVSDASATYVGDTDQHYALHTKPTCYGFCRWIFGVACVETIFLLKACSHIGRGLP